ncbi:MULTISPECIES: type II toxin-antitoxin system PemK/MazF family toxin [Lentzea]|uniref:PemK-like, MazF-like toxin of type II toxin-antitoxin system n=1 Tax=Lentzea flaviverrucosa TaxID=200379 RepID=A0A1H9XHG0_9PSEU|nr:MULTISPECIES: type II toxin-antitoxin system PemK/MazF family toxin [Lentzea]MCR3751767.1 PemK-like, MazF-like toxin of type II toxin-antitoxin system [Lentzea californiensis]RDI20167.1 PemK-like, MazF-like toxin of type II toxin-antitoxin system [Lentzea flaviverrucosa]SES45638.1 PemK-like, MazF-like toxin of type II toxin-antitoxin system [Lentzea flaviverrucosa]
MQTNGEDPRPAKGAVREISGAAQATKLDYAPTMDGDADPGEVVWAWVPFEEDATRGKDRPLLVVGHANGDLVALMLSSKEPRDDFVELGAGAWDRDGRPSYLRLDRVFALDSDDEIRREGAVLAPAAFGLVVDALRERHGWR